MLFECTSWYSRTPLIFAITTGEVTPNSVCWTQGYFGMRAVPPAGMSSTQAEVLCRGPPLWQLRFPVGTRVEISSIGRIIGSCSNGKDVHHTDGTVSTMRDEARNAVCITGWERGTVVSHWWQSTAVDWVTGEWAPYQLVLDARPNEVFYVGTDNVNLPEHPQLLRRAVPDSPRRRVTQVDKPSGCGGDWFVEAASNTKEGKDEGRGLRCTYCGKCCVENRHCRGCLASVFCNGECQRLGWQHHKIACKAAAAGNIGAAEDLVAAAASTYKPTDGQVLNSLHRIILRTDIGQFAENCLQKLGTPGMCMNDSVRDPHGNWPETLNDVVSQLAADVGICADSDRKAEVKDMLLTLFV